MERINCLPSRCLQVLYHWVKVGRGSLYERCRGRRLYDRDYFYQNLPPLDCGASSFVCAHTTSSKMDPTNPTQTPNVSNLLKSLGSDEDPDRKMAAFKLQTLINDPSFAELFVQEGGLPKLRLLVLESSGNTLAYGLASFARLLDVDQGWEAVDNAVVERVGLALSMISMG